MTKFTHFFHSQKPTDESASKPVVYKLQSAQDLLAVTQNQRYVNFIKKYAKAPAEYFEAFYLPLIESFAEITQSITDNLPDEQGSNDCLLHIGLLRCAYALLLRHRMYVPANPSENDLTEDYGLWTFVVFSSALYGITSKLMTHYQINLSNEENKNSLSWHPLLGTPLAQGMDQMSYKKLNPKECNEEPSYSLLIAKHLMPIDGFLWIAQNPKALAFWVSALNEDTEGAEQVGAVLSLADYLQKTQFQLNTNQDMLGYIEAFLRSQGQEAASLEELTKLVKSAEIIPPVSANLDENTTLGKEFITWLKKGISNKTISVNASEAHVHMTSEGVFLLFPQIFIDFCKSFPKYVNWVVVYKQFNYLGMAKLDGGDTLFEKFFGTSPEHAQKYSAKKVTGVILNNTSVLFSQNNMPSNSQYIVNKPSSPTRQTHYPSLTNKSDKLTIKN